MATNPLPVRPRQPPAPPIARPPGVPDQLTPAKPLFPTPNHPLGRYVAAAFLVAVICLTAVVGVIVSRHQSSSAATPIVIVAQTTPPALDPSTDPNPDPTVGPTDDPTTDPAVDPIATTDPPADPNTAALQQLQAYQRADLASETFRGQWVAQLASKAPGTTDTYATAADGSHVFQLTDILHEHQALRDNPELGTVVLLLSTDYGDKNGVRRKYDGQALWVTFADNGFSSLDDVHTWCAEQFPTLSGPRLKDSCAARQLEPGR